jgi:hypothetical protein
MGEVKYRSVVRIERHRGPLRSAWVPGREDPVAFGVHSAIAEHYNVDPDEHPPETTTIDYVIAAAAG